MDLSDILTKIQTLDDIYRMKETRMICIKYLLFLLNLTFSVSDHLSLSIFGLNRNAGKVELANWPGVFCYCYLGRGTLS